MAHTRRQFIHTGCKALSATALLSGLGRFALIDALAQSRQPTDYRALVCVFLFGGNDTNNVVIPYTNYGDYAAVRNSMSANFAVPQDQLLQINPGGGGLLFGFNPKLGEATAPAGEGGGPFTTLYDLWNSGVLAVVCNTGPLNQLVTRSQYRAGGAGVVPYQLFSHSDQQNSWQTAYAPGPRQTGWGGTTADVTHLGSESFPAISSIAGVTVFSTGRNTQPLVLSPAPSKLGDSLHLLRTQDEGAIIDALTADGSDVMPSLIQGAAQISNTALDVSTALGSSDPTLNTAFPNTSLGNQLKQVAKIISFIQNNPGLGVQRQIFFTSLGGFDTHTGQGVFGTDNGQLKLLRQVSQAIGSFYQSTVDDLGIPDQITTFTSSDFSRTFVPGGGNTGTDHAWGSHHFVTGGAVLGGDFYGQYPPLVLGINNPADSDSVDTDNGANSRGRWIPTTSVEQYAATLAYWYGLAQSDRSLVFPNITTFWPDPTQSLGFMATSGAAAAAARLRRRS